jgi:hypothetical protein
LGLEEPLQVSTVGQVGVSSGPSAPVVVLEGVRGGVIAMDSWSKDFDRGRLAEIGEMHGRILRQELAVPTVLAERMNRSGGRGFVNADGIGELGVGLGGSLSVAGVEGQVEAFFQHGGLTAFRMGDLVVVRHPDSCVLVHSGGESYEIGQNVKLFPDLSLSRFWIPDVLETFGYSSSDRSASDSVGNPLVQMTVSEVGFVVEARYVVGSTPQTVWAWTELPTRLSVLPSWLPRASTSYGTWPGKAFARAIDDRWHIASEWQLGFLTATAEAYVDGERDDVDRYATERGLEVRYRDAS